MLKIKLVSLAIFTALTAASSIASASLITFDDITLQNNSTIISNGYQGFDWKGFTAINGQRLNNTGYAYGTVSKDNIAYILGNKTSSFSSNTAFTLNDLFITKAYESGLTRIQGYVGSTLTFSKDIITSKTAPTLAQLDWQGLNRVTFTGVNSSSQIVFDNIRVNEPVAPVPEPETYALMSMGLVGLLAARRRKAK